MGPESISTRRLRLDLNFTMLFEADLQFGNSVRIKAIRSESETWARLPPRWTALDLNFRNSAGVTVGFENQNDLEEGK